MEGPHQNQSAERGRGTGGGRGGAVPLPTWGHHRATTGLWLRSGSPVPPHQGREGFRTVEGGGGIVCALKL